MLELFSRKKPTFIIGLIIAVVFGLLYLVGLAMPNLNSGPPYAPGRIVLGYFYYGLLAGLTLIMWSYFSSHVEWLYPWQKPSEKVEVFTSRRIINIAVTGVATIVFAFIKIPILGWSIRTSAPLFAAMYWGFPEGVLGTAIGYILSTLIVGGYETPLVLIPVSWLLDGSMIGLVSIFYFKWIRGRPAKTRSWRYALMVLTGFAYWYVVAVCEIPGLIGYALFPTYAFLYFLGGIILTPIIVAIAIGGVEALSKTRTRR